MVSHSFLELQWMGKRRRPPNREKKFKKAVEKHGRTCREKKLANLIIFISMNLSHSHMSLISTVTVNIKMERKRRKRKEGDDEMKHAHTISLMDHTIT